MHRIEPGGILYVRYLASSIIPVGNGSGESRVGRRDVKLLCFHPMHAVVSERNLCRDIVNRKQVVVNRVVPIRDHTGVGCP